MLIFFRAKCRNVDNAIRASWEVLKENKLQKAINDRMLSNPAVSASITSTNVKAITAIINVFVKTIKSKLNQRSRKTILTLNRTSLNTL